MTLRFFYNGIKGSDGKLQKASYSQGPFTSFPAGTVTIYAAGVSRFSSEVVAEFDVENQSDSRSDYFEGDKIRVRPDHKLYSVVMAGFVAQQARQARRVMTQVAAAARLFIGVFPAGISYADRARNVGGDYAKLAFISYATLELRFAKDCPDELRADIIAHAATLQAKRGKPFEISASGQTIILGGK